MKALGGKTGRLVGLEPSAVGGGTEAGVQSTHWGNCLSQRRNIYESEPADLWQPKCNENQRVLAQPYISQTGTRVPWKVQWLGAGVWGVWSDPRVRAAVDCREMD